MDMICSFRTEATLVANEFIDRYMAAANGEYVKVYLYLLRHQQDTVDVEGIADALNHTEADVKRALAYWERMGALKYDRQDEPAQEKPFFKEEQAVKETDADPASEKGSQERIDRLAEDEDFTQLFYIAQKYMNKIFTSRECQVFAYLYDELHMAAELLEYLVEYCVQSGHTSIRYIETVGLDWHEKRLRTIEDARAYSSSFTKSSFAVMRCFGLTDRKPGDREKQMIEKWFSSYGFSLEVVLEACNRTMAAIHSPSFRYADKILEEWKKAGVRTVRDIELLDEKRQTRKDRRTVKKASNQFHNFQQRDTDYDAMVLDQVKSWIGTEPVR